MPQRKHWPKLNLNSLKTVQVNVRVPQSIVDGVTQALERCPQEFRTAAEFHRTALVNELKRRGIMNDYE